MKNEWPTASTFCSPARASGIFYRYAYIEIDGCDAQQTKCISGTLNPEWNETRGAASFLPNQVAPTASCRFTFKIDKPMSKELKVKVRRRRH